MTKVGYYSLASIIGVLAMTGCAQLPKPASPPPIATVVAPPPSPPPRPSVVSKNDRDLVTDRGGIMAAQRSLIQLGYTVGKPDGVLGPTTQKAVGAFQKDHGLAEDERL